MPVEFLLLVLTAWLQVEFDVSVAETTVGKVLRRLSYAKLSARPRHDTQGPEALETWKKTFPAQVQALRAELGPEVKGPAMYKKRISN